MNQTNHNTRSNEVVEIDLLALARALWHRAWAIVLSSLLAAGIAFAYTFFCITPLYKASVMMYVNNSSFSVGSTSVSLSDLSAAQSLVDTYIVILKTRSSLDEVIEKAELDYTYEELYDMISAAAVNSTEVFQIEVTSADPFEAEEIANTIAEILPDKISDIVEGSSARVVDYAVVPSVKSSPSITRNTAMGLLVGFVLSCGIILLLELTDEQIRDEDYLVQTYDLPILAVVPDLTQKGSDDSYYSGYGYGKATSHER